MHAELSSATRGCGRRVCPSRSGFTFGSVQRRGCDLRFASHRGLVSALRWLERAWQRIQVPLREQELAVCADLVGGKHLRSVVLPGCRRGMLVGRVDEDGHPTLRMRSVSKFVRVRCRLRIRRLSGERSVLASGKLFGARGVSGDQHGPLSVRPVLSLSRGRRSSVPELRVPPELFRNAT
jgi:hypothetical protein